MSQDYPYIRKWGKLLGSFPHYIRDQVEQARADGAPQNATHKSPVDPSNFGGPHRWYTTDDVKRADTREALGLPPLEASS